MKISISATPPHPSATTSSSRPARSAASPRICARPLEAYRYVVIADATVARLHGARVMAGLEEAGLRVDLLTVPSGEENKTRERWSELSDSMLEREVGRNAAVVSLGGGVTGDLAGFVAATYMRGLPFIQVPTSLLAMLDASVGGKVGVDTPLGKNLVGAFHQPRRVVIDPEVVETLPGDRDAGRARGGGQARRDRQCRVPAVDRGERRGAPRAKPQCDRRAGLRSVEIKASFVERDPLEAGARAALNFGHTIGHALELLTNYALPHGHAVAIGMVVEARAGETAGVTEPGTADTLRHVLTTLGLPVTVPEGIDLAQVLDATRLDKKARRARARYALVERIGKVARGESGEWTQEVEIGDLGT